MISKRQSAQIGSIQQKLLTTPKLFQNNTTSTVSGPVQPS